MNLKEMLKVADDIVFAKTGKHLDDLEEAVLRGTLERETYKVIARDFDCSESNVRNTGSKLWKIIAKELGENVNKSNFRAAMERLQSSNVLNFVQNVSHSFNICGESRHPPDIPNPHQKNENISQFSSGELAGKYKSGYEDYRTLFKQILGNILSLWAIARYFSYSLSCIAESLGRSLEPCDSVEPDHVT
ncbi:MAG: hypothetical protein WB539_06200 [Planktothrix agardhii]|jgi:hypothetical protein|uniref:hypothetical protein n=1 Tax=Planktothrix agardhii TaxID=1160 RepID=UPI003C6A099C